jgi:hypothetical protein
VLAAALSEALKEAEITAKDGLFAESKPSTERGEGRSGSPVEKLEKELSFVQQTINQAAATQWKITKLELEAIDTALAEY